MIIMNLQMLKFEFFLVQFQFLLSNVFLNAMLLLYIKDKQESIKGSYILKVPSEVNRVMQINAIQVIVSCMLKIL